MVDIVGFDFVGYFNRIGQRFGQVGEHLVHLGRSFKPFLFGIEHALFVRYFFIGRKAYQALMGFGILFVDEMYVVTAYYFYT